MMLFKQQTRIVCGDPSLEKSVEPITLPNATPSAGPSNKIEIFQALADRGFNLIPLVGKDPSCNGPDWQKYCNLRRRFDPSEFKERNAGLPCGSLNGIVLDQDDPSFEYLAEKAGLELPPTLTVRTGAGGYHRIYRYPNDNGTRYGCRSVKHPVFSDVTIFDIKGDGGQVVAPGSVHPDTGNYYEIVDDVSISDAPEWLLLAASGKLDIDTSCLQTIPPGRVKDTQKTIYRLKGISDRIKELILTPQPVGSRSEAIMSVLKALIGAGLHENIIVWVFDLYPIGEKYRENGAGKHRWLQGEIDRARKHNEDEPTTSQEKKKKKKSTADALVGLVPEDGLFHSPEGNAFCDLGVEGHRETLPVRSKDFRDWLSYQFYQKYERVPAGQALKDALTTIAGKAQFKGPCRDVAVRIAGIGDHYIYIDLGSPDWSVIEVDNEGWRIRPSSPVRFWRPRGLLELPRPQGPGSVESLKDLLNLDSIDTFKLIIGYLLCAIRPKGPYPVLVFTGEQGTGKSGAARTIRRIIDPNVADLRTTARNEQDLVIAARNGLIIALDNLSVVKDWLSDALCRLATGGGFGTRELYSDTDEILINVMRPIIVNGIEDVCVRGDLADRSIRVELPVIPSNKRITEAALNCRFNDARPGILAGLLDAASSGLRHVDDVTLPKLPRMADAAIWWCACERSGALPWREGGILDAFTGSRASIVADFMEHDPVSCEVSKLIMGRGAFSGSVAELLKVLNGQRGGDQDRRFWPATARGLSGKLKRAAPFLRESGIEIIRPARTGKSRPIKIIECENIRFSSSQPSPSPSENKKIQENNGLSDDGINDGTGVLSVGCDGRGFLSSLIDIEENQDDILFSDGHDGCDDKKRDFYGDDHDVEFI